MASSSKTDDEFFDPAENFAEAPKPDQKSKLKKPAEKPKKKTDVGEEQFLRNDPEKLKKAAEARTNGEADMGEALGGLGEAMGGAMSGMLKPMMGKFYTKDFLYPSFKAANDMFPEYLEMNKDSLPEEDYERYSKQAELYQKVVEEFENESESDTEDVKAERQNKIILYCEKVKPYGELPDEIRLSIMEHQSEPGEMMGGAMGAALEGMVEGFGQLGKNNEECCVQ